MRGGGHASLTLAWLWERNAPPGEARSNRALHSAALQTVCKSLAIGIVGMARPGAACSDFMNALFGRSDFRRALECVMLEA